MSQARFRLICTLAIPCVLLPSTALTFKLASQAFGRETGYLGGFLFYWVFWCFFIPWLVLGKPGFTSLLADRVPLFTRHNWPAALLWSVVTLVAIFMYGQAFVRAPLALILVAILLATVNSVWEESLWCGLYVRVFPRHPWLAIVYPAAGFALWHFAPQSVFPAENVTGISFPPSFWVWPTASLPTARVPPNGPRYHTA